MVDASSVAFAAKSIAATLITEGKYLYGVEDEVRALQNDLECMQEFLQNVDANPNLVKQDGQLRILTQKMRELAFRAEDAIDTFLVDVQTKVYNKNLCMKVVCLASHSYPVHILRKEIESIQLEIDKAKARSEKYALSIPHHQQQQGSGVGSSYSRPNAENYLHLNDEFVVGIEDDITKLVKQLTDPGGDFRVVAIVGTGGAGKTTLASQIYRHNKVQSWFSHKAFVCVSQQWSRFDILGRIFKEVLGRSDQIPSTEIELVRQLHDFMKDKQCLVVLDDIWKKEAWDDIYPIFPHTNGVRVMLTTRIEEVCLHADRNCDIHKPQLLTENQMWALFRKGAVEGRKDIENNVEFEKLGKQMLEKCQGLPLAAVTLAGILRTKEQLYEWERINKSCSEFILQEKGGSTYGVVEDMIELSYLDLPTYLKPCFLYLAIIREDMEFTSEQLTRMWIAEGFISNVQQMRCVTLEDVAMQLLNDLAQRYILQVVKRNTRGEIKRIRLHDLMREYCAKKAINCNFLETCTSIFSDVRRPSQSRRTSVFSSEYWPEENHHLRTLVVCCTKKDTRLGEKLESIHKEFKLLGVLRITNEIDKFALPKEIGNLVHLTYLCLDNANIRKLPKSIRNLHNLIYFECYGHRRVIIPDDLVANMMNLRVLILYHFMFPNRLGLSGSKKLHTLRCGAGKWMRQDLLPSLTDLAIYGVKEIEEMEAIHQCLNILKDSLQTFRCIFNANDNQRYIPEFDMLKLSDCQTLWSLVLLGSLANTSTTIQFPPNLVSLTLCETRIPESVDLMEILGQLPKLKHLCLDCDAYMGTRLSCTGAAFPQLQELQFLELCNLEEWRVEGYAMSRLVKIRIFLCRKLKRLPEGIKSITTLAKLHIYSMPMEFCKRLGYEVMETGEGEDSYIIHHIPDVKFTNIHP